MRTVRIVDASNATEVQNTKLLENDHWQWTFSELKRHLRVALEQFRLQ